MSMRHPDLDYWIEKERRRDQLAEAARYRLIKEARMASQTSAERQPLWITRVVDRLLLVTARTLSYLGGRLLNWGCRLETRYQVLAGVGVENHPSPCS